MNSLKQYTDLAEKNRRQIDANSFPALNRLRCDAAKNLDGSTLPATGSEGYVYSVPDKMFAPDFGINIGRLPFQADVAEAFRCDVPNLSTLLGVVVNDSFHPSASLLKNLPEGVDFSSLRQAAEKFPELIENHLGKIAPLSNSTVALNTLLAQDGVFIRLRSGVRLDKPLQLVNIFNASFPLMGVRRILIIAEPYSSASVLFCDHTQSPELSFLSSTVTEVFVENNADLSIYDVESSTPDTARHSDLYVRQADGSQFTYGGFTLSCGTTRNNINVDIEGSHCSTSIGGMAIAGNNQIIDNNTRLTHNAPKSKSNQLFKYVLDNEARGAFEGRILVKENACGTEAYQANRNILAADAARMHTEPQLEIYCDDVKCSHGATTGQLDAEALFYMRTRGIPEQQARVMLMQAFMADVVDSVKMESLRQRLHLLVERRFNGHASTCADYHTQCQK